MVKYLDITDENIELIEKKVQESFNYGKEGKIIHDVLNKFPLNNDINIIAMKISVIDLTNSTHLSQYKSKISLYELAEVILNIKDFDERVKNGDFELVNIIARNNGKVNLFSFASKYCAYHNFEIYGNDDYYIYDSVVRRTLPKYSDITGYAIDKFRTTYDYQSFKECIDKVLDKHNIKIDKKRRKFDHFMWYPNR